MQGNDHTRKGNLDAIEKIVFPEPGKRYERGREWFLHPNEDDTVPHTPLLTR